MNAIENGTESEYIVKMAFMSVISHETQTPLAIIKESLSLVLDGIAGPLDEKQSRLIQIAQDNVSRLSLLISGMADWVQLESGETSLRLVNFNLVFLMQQEIDRVRQLAEKKEIS